MKATVHIAHNLAKNTIHRTSKILRTQPIELNHFPSSVYLLQKVLTGKEFSEENTRCVTTITRFLKRKRNNMLQTYFLNIPYQYSYLKFPELQKFQIFKDNRFALQRKFTK